MLSPAARLLFPYSIECKNTETLNVWAAWKQACANAGEHEPLLIIKRNRAQPLAVVDAKHFTQTFGPYLIETLWCGPVRWHSISIKGTGAIV